MWREKLNIHYIYIVFIYVFYDENNNNNNVTWRQKAGFCDVHRYTTAC
jgi:hypothetical protein